MTDFVSCFCFSLSNLLRIVSQKKNDGQKRYTKQTLDTPLAFLIGELSSRSKESTILEEGRRII